MPAAAKVLIDGPSELIFDYAVPEGVSALPGCRVRVPLRNKSATGTILSVGTGGDSGFELKPIDSLIDPEPLVTGKLIELARWMARYYGTPLEQIMRSLLPGAVRQETHSAKTRQVAELVQMPGEDELDKLSRRASRQHTILLLLQSSGPLPVADLGGASVRSSLKALQEAGYLAITDEEVRRDPDAGEEFLESRPHDLNDGQRAAYRKICLLIDTSIKRSGRAIPIPTTANHQQNLSFSTGSPAREKPKSISRQPSIAWTRGNPFLFSSPKSH